MKERELLMYAESTGIWWDYLRDRIQNQAVF